MQKVSFYAMGCHMMAALDDETPKAAERLAEVPAWFEAWEQRLSRFREDSELCQLNRLAGTPVRVSKTLWKVLQAALQAERQSEGLVTPALLGALEYAGYNRSFSTLLHSAMPTVEHPAPPVAGMQVVEFDEFTRRVWMPEGFT